MNTAGTNQPLIRAVAWGGAAMFAVSFLYFVFSYAVTFGEILPGSPRLGAIVWNVMLFTGFALHHSVFARERVRAAVARIVPPQLERSVYVWVASLLFIGVCAAWARVPSAIWRLDGPVTWLLYAVQIFGIWLTLRSAAVIDVWELSGVRQVSTPNAQRLTMDQLPNVHDHALGVGSAKRVGRWEFKTDGPYGWVRHPIYLGWFLTLFAASTMTMTRFVFAVVSCAYLVIAIPYEERSLRIASGGVYDEYVAKVRWKLIPYVY